MNQKVIAAKMQLAERIDRLTHEEGLIVTEIPSLALVKRVKPAELIGGLKEPIFGLIAQGAKRVMLGEETYDFNEEYFLLTSVDLPLMGRIIEAGPEKPYLAVMLKIDTKQVARMIAENKSLRLPVNRDPHTAVSRVSEKLINAVTRLVDLIDNPEDIAFLSPLIQHEILYRLLTGPQGVRLRQMVTAGTRYHQISRMTTWIKENFRATVRLEDFSGYGRHEPFKLSYPL